MTIPVYRPPGLAYEATSRYRDSRFYTPPDPVIIAAFVTILVKFAEKYDIAILAYCLMGSHDHIIPIDRDPNRASHISLFKQQVHACMGKFLQAYWDLPDDEVYSTKVAAQLFPILDHGRLVEKIAYVEANFVSAGLVASNNELPPGAVSTREMMVEPLVVERPDFWFRKNKWPDKVELKLEVPEWYLEKEGLTEEQFRFETARELYIRMYEANWTRMQEGLPVKGLEALQEEDPYEAQKDEVSKTKVLFTGNDSAKNAKHYIDSRRFQRSYARAKGRVKEGKHDTTFPFGTCKMAVSYGFKMYVPPG